ncbi:MaoC family dehydratase N-terminal domain-containing protein [Amycolatopsis sp. FDAARGOS 1241]|uniref:FAS1-like dehydratase domain-containing protein n=1 Tax=Amycolatopsis sp. FDAARGOS 1241 TaxID=2778070 RepID=UPI00194EB9FF|nr:MaoC family dehydratase N-terminal domain-containing protein [Amycolatopsis sp. FDAARGOS 1241]QRP43127.1 MaoC family dehydratase N-terminal domain-containing protein [Amycolatopsis sp. FDAARGOS 1241]
MTTTWCYTLTDLVRYSGAALDFNTIHHDAPAARAAGFAGVVAHGMLTLGRVLAHLADEAGPAGLAACRARFRAPVHLDTPLSLTAQDRPGGVDLTVTCGDTVALTAEADLGPAPPPPAEPADAPVADHRLRVERGPLTQLARAVGARAPFWYDTRAAEQAGLAGVPGIPTLAFALPAFGWYPDEQPGSGARPDPVADSARWACSTGPVVHGGQTFTYHRPLVAGETVRSRHWITGRTTKTGRAGDLRFTDVTQLITGSGGEPVVSATATLLATGPA